MEPYDTSKPGLAYICTNFEFGGDGSDDLPDGATEHENTKKLFDSLGFITKAVINQTAEQIENFFLEGKSSYARSIYIIFCQSVIAVHSDGCV